MVYIVYLTKRNKKYYPLFSVLYENWSVENEPHHYCHDEEIAQNLCRKLTGIFPEYNASYYILKEIF